MRPSRQGFSLTLLLAVLLPVLTGCPSEDNEKQNEKGIAAASVSRGNLQISSLSFPSTTLVPGQTSTASLTIQNTGDDPSRVDVAELNASLPNLFQITRTTNLPSTVPAGGQTTIEFDVTVDPNAQTGQTVDFSAEVLGASNFFPRGDVSEVPTTLTIANPADLTIDTITAGPSLVLPGQTGITVTMDVSNNEAGTATVNSAGLTFTGSADRTGEYTVTPDAGNPTSVTGGTTETFTFTVDVAASATEETITIDGTIDGTGPGAATLTDSTATTTDSWTVQGATLEFASATSTLTEDGSTQTITVRLNVPGGGTTPGTITVDVTDTTNNGTGIEAEANDYTFTDPTTVTFNPGSSNGATETANVTVTADSLVEGSETIEFTLANPTGGASLDSQTIHNATIPDANTAQVDFTNATSTAAETGGAHAVSVTLTTGGDTLENSLDVEITDELTGNATSNADYTALGTPETVTFPATSGDAATVNLSITITDDPMGNELVEGTETIDLSLAVSAIAPSTVTASGQTTHRVDITDSDAATIGFTAASSLTNSEQAVAHNVAVTLSTTPATATLQRAASVDVTDAGGGSATSTTDYTAVGTQALSFTAGDGDGASPTPANVTVTPIDDDTFEGSETVNLSLAITSGDATAGTVAHTVTINDDDRLVGTSTFPGNLYQGESSTGTETLLSSAGLRGFQGIQSLAWDGTSNFVYAVDTETDLLLSVNDVGNPTIIGPVGFDNVEALAYDTDNGILYGVDNATDNLITIDVATGQGTVVGATGAAGADITGLAYIPQGDPNAGLYGADNATDDLVVFDVGTGGATSIGSFFNATNVRGLAYDTANFELLGLDATDDAMYTIDPTGGFASFELNIEYQSPEAVALVNGQIVGIDDVPAHLMSTPLRESPTATVVGTFDSVTPVTDIPALAYDSNNDILYGVDPTNDNLHTLDPSNGSILTTTALSLTGNIQGLAYDINTNTLYGVDPTADQVYTITPAGTVTALNNKYDRDDASITNVVALAFDPNTNTLYGLDNDGDGVLVTIVPDTLADEGVATTKAFAFVGGEGLTFNAETNRLFASRQFNASSDYDLVEIDPSNGNSNNGFIQQIEGETEAVEGLAVIPTAVDVYYGSNTADGTLLSFPLGSTIAGGVGFPDIRGTATDGTTMWAVDATAGTLLTVNTTTGVGTTVGPIGFADVQALAWDGTTLFGADDATDQLLSIDTTTGEGTALGTFTNTVPATVTGIRGLAANATTLWGADDDGDQIYTISKTDGSCTATASALGGTPILVGLTVDGGGTLFGSDIVGGGTSADLVTIDATGAITARSGIGFDNVAALTHDGANFLAIDQTTDTAMTLAATGEGTTFGAIGIDNATALATDGTTTWAVNTSLGWLYTVNVITGTVTAIGDTGLTDVQGLAVDPAGPTLYAVDTTANQIYTLSTTDGSSTALANPIDGANRNVQSLAYGNGTLYAVANDDQTLLEIDLTTTVGSIATEVGGTGALSFTITGLAFDQTTTPGLRLFGYDPTNSQFVEIDEALGTGVGTGLDTVDIPLPGLTYR